MSTGINVAKQIKVLDDGSLLTPDVNQIDFTGSGITATTVGNNVTVNVVAASGVWGIANTSGVYTYYATLTLAMAAATSGQTIELFADVTETAAVTITLKNGVSINGNGHTYNYTNASGNCFQGGDNTACYIYDLKISRTNTTPIGAYIFYGVGVGFGNLSIYCKNVYVYYTYTSSVGSTPIIYNNANTSIILDGLFAYANGSGTMLSAVGGTGLGVFNNCTVVNTGTGNGMLLNSGSTADNCNIQVNSGTGVSNESTISNSKIISDTGIAASNISTNILQGKVSNCYLYSRTYRASNETSCYSCTIISESGLCSYGSGIYSSYCYTNTGAIAQSGFTQPEFYNSYMVSQAAAGITANLGTTVINSTIVCNWNNAGGHCINVNNFYGALTYVYNSHLRVTNASANCIKASGAGISSKYTNNVFSGATTPVNANVTQAIVNTQDNQGNILV